jgi:hypothetical protein
MERPYVYDDVPAGTVMTNTNSTLRVADLTRTYNASKNHNNVVGAKEDWVKAVRQHAQVRETAVVLATRAPDQSLFVTDQYRGQRTNVVTAAGQTLSQVRESLGAKKTVATQQVVFNTRTFSDGDRTEEQLRTRFAALGLPLVLWLHDAFKSVHNHTPRIPRHDAVVVANGVAGEHETNVYVAEDKTTLHEIQEWVKQSKVKTVTFCWLCPGWGVPKTIVDTFPPALEVRFKLPAPFFHSRIFPSGNEPYVCSITKETRAYLAAFCRYEGRTPADGSHVFTSSTPAPWLEGATDLQLENLVRLFDCHVQYRNAHPSTDEPALYLQPRCYRELRPSAGVWERMLLGIPTVDDTAPTAIAAVLGSPRDYATCDQAMYQQLLIPAVFTRGAVRRLLVAHDTGLGKTLTMLTTAALLFADGCKVAIVVPSTEVRLQFYTDLLGSAAMHKTQLYQTVQAAHRSENPSTPFAEWLHTRVELHGNTDGFTRALSGRVLMLQYGDLLAILKSNAAGQRTWGMDELCSDQKEQTFENVHVIMDEAHRVLPEDPDNVFWVEQEEPGLQRDLRVTQAKAEKEAALRLALEEENHGDGDDVRELEKSVAAETSVSATGKQLDFLRMQLATGEWRTNLARLGRFLRASKATIMFTATPRPSGSMAFRAWWPDDLRVHAMYEHHLLPGYRWGTTLRYEPADTIRVVVDESRSNHFKDKARQFSRGGPQIGSTLGADAAYLQRSRFFSCPWDIPGSDAGLDLSGVCQTDAHFKTYQPFCHLIESAVLEPLRSEKVVVILGTYEFTVLQYRYQLAKKAPGCVFYAVDSRDCHTTVPSIQEEPHARWLPAAVAAIGPLHLFLEVQKTDTRLLEGLNLQSFTHLVLVDGFSDPKSIRQAIGRLRRLCDSQWIRDGQTKRLVIPVVDCDQTALKALKAFQDAPQDGAEAYALQLGAPLLPLSVPEIVLYDSKKVLPKLKIDIPPTSVHQSWERVLMAVAHWLPELKTPLQREGKELLRRINKSTTDLLECLRGSIRREYTVEPRLSRHGPRAADCFLFAARKEDVASRSENGQSNRPHSSQGSKRTTGLRRASKRTRQGSSGSTAPQSSSVKGVQPLTNRRVLLVRESLLAWVAVYSTDSVVKAGNAGKYSCWKDGVLYTNKDIVENFKVSCVLRRSVHPR